MKHNLITSALASLAKERPLFHAEADLQLALALKLQLAHAQSAVRCEVPVRGTRSQRIDIVITDEARHGVELKYVPAALTHSIGGEDYDLRPGPRDIRRHDFLKDIARLEAFGGGTAILLTNDPHLWTTPKPSAIDASFSLAEGRVVGTEPHGWAAHASAGSMKTRTEPITLSGKYKLSWQTYSDLCVKNGLFRMLVVEVPSL